MTQEEFQEIQRLLHQRADLNARLSLIPYEGTPEVKERGESRYLYMRKRIGGKVTSTYVGAYSDELHQLLLKNAAEARDLRKQIRRIDKALAQHGYAPADLAPRVALNLDFARANMKASIYDQAILEGVATSFPQTEEIIENGKVNGMTASDVQKILNLKHAWEFILDEDVLLCSTGFAILSHIARLVNEGFFRDGGQVRGVPVTIGGTSYVPPLPQETAIIERIEALLADNVPPIDVAINLCLYCMKAQVFTDGNKRASILLANHFLISHGEGLLVVPEADVPRFKELLIAYYEERDEGKLAAFMKDRCWRRF